MHKRRGGVKTAGQGSGGAENQRKRRSDRPDRQSLIFIFTKKFVWLLMLFLVARLLTTSTYVVILLDCGRKTHRNQTKKCNRCLKLLELILKIYLKSNGSIWHSNLAVSFERKGYTAK